MPFIHKISGEIDHAHDTVDEARVCMDHQSQIEAEEAAFQGAAEAEQAYERWLENGGAHADIIAWEHQQDELRANSLR